MDQGDTYKTIQKPSAEVLYKDRNSKFYGYAFPVPDEGSVKTHLQSLKDRHRSARHWCYAYRLGTGPFTYRVNDDGEPNNSAGQPIYGQIQSYGLTNVLVVVVRYFGGTKLGVGGLIQAYRTAAHLALDSAKVVVHTIDMRYRLQFGYKDLSRVMRILKAKRLEIVHQKLESECELLVDVPKKDSSAFVEQFDRFYDISVQPIEL